MIFQKNFFGLERLRLYSKNLSNFRILKKKSTILFSIKNEPHRLILRQLEFSKKRKFLFHRIQHRNPFFMKIPAYAKTHAPSVATKIDVFLKIRNCNNILKKSPSPTIYDLSEDFFSDFLQISNLSTSSGMEALVTVRGRFRDGGVTGPNHGQTMECHFESHLVKQT